MKMAPAYRFKDPLSLPQVGIDRLADAASPAIWLEPGTSKRRYLRRAPFAHLDPDDAGVFGKLGTAEITYPPVFAASIAEATLVGFRTLIKDDWFLIDETFPDAASTNRYLDRIDSADEHRNERTGLRRIEGTDTFRREERSDSAVRVTQPTIVLGSNEPANYGSFLFRILPKVLLYRYLAQPCKILVALPHKSMARLLEICGVPQSDVVPHDAGKVYHLDRAIVPSVRNPHAFLDEVTIGLFEGFRASVASLVGENRDLIFVSRKNLGSTRAGYRSMENEAEVRRCMEQLGFRTICPETMTADEQIAAFASAAVVVGQSGGAMFNVAFCRPGTVIIDIESEPHWIHAHMSYFSSLNLRYAIFEAKALRRDDRDIHLPFRVNVAALTSLLEEVLGSNLHHVGRRRVAQKSVSETRFQRLAAMQT
jgi:capsular polysaccharide biosynthesis protein